MHIFSSWVEPNTTTKRLTVAVLLPSGVGPGQFSIRVAEDGGALEFTMIWPDPFINMSILHRKWLQSQSDDRIEGYHPKLIGFEHHLKSFRSRSSDIVESTARIVLLFQVQSNISQKFNLAWSENSARVVYVELRGQEEQYGASNDNDSFEIC